MVLDGCVAGEVDPIRQHVIHIRGGKPAPDGGCPGRIVWALERRRWFADAGPGAEDRNPLIGPRAFGIAIGGDARRVASSKYWGGMRTVVSCAEALQKSSPVLPHTRLIARSMQTASCAQCRAGKKRPGCRCPTSNAPAGRGPKRRQARICDTLRPRRAPARIATCQGTAQQRIVRAHTGGSELLGGVGDFA